MLVQHSHGQRPCKRLLAPHATGPRVRCEDPQNRLEHAVERTAPMALWAYTLVVLWYVKWGQHTRAARVPQMPWYTSKAAPAFSDMLATLRRASWLERLSVPCRDVPTLRKVVRPIPEYMAAWTAEHERSASTSHARRAGLLTQAGKLPKTSLESGMSWDAAARESCVRRDSRCPGGDLILQVTPHRAVASLGSTITPKECSTHAIGDLGCCWRFDRVPLGGLWRRWRRRQRNRQRRGWWRRGPGFRGRGLRRRHGGQCRGGRRHRW
jgi:hypothetical protein